MMLQLHRANKEKIKNNDICCVGVHIQHATFILAISIFVGCCVLIAVDTMNVKNTEIRPGDLFSYVYYTLWRKAYYHVLIDIVLNSIWAISSVILLIGNLRLNATLYWPFIAISYINIAVCTLKAALFTLAAVSVFKNDVEEVPKGGRAATCIQIILLIGLNCMVLLVAWYSVGVITRAREFLLRHRQVRTKSMQMEIKKCTLHLDGYQAPSN